MSYEEYLNELNDDKEFNDAIIKAAWDLLMSEYTPNQRIRLRDFARRYGMPKVRWEPI